MATEQKITFTLPELLEQRVDAATFQAGFWAGQREAFKDVLKMLAFDEEEKEEEVKSTP